MFVAFWIHRILSASASICFHQRFNVRILASAELSVANRGGRITLPRMTSPRQPSRNPSRSLAAAAAITLAGAAAFEPLPIRAADSEALQVARQLNRAFVEVTEAVSSSVVVISVTQKPDAEELEQMKELRRLLPPGSPHGNPGPVEGQGSGVIIRPEGFIVTNFHVVDGADSIRVRLQDGREYKATVRGTHEEADLAVIRIEGADSKLPSARFGDSEKVRVGEFAIAVGAPYELDYSVTFGHVSAKGRANLYGGPVEQDFIQTDASINFGNSGGPLVNLEGEVIGINSMIRGVGTGIGFAIPANQVKVISDRIIKDGVFRRSWLGISMPKPFELARLKADMPALRRGVLVKAIPENGPASRSKLEPGDIITSVDGKPVKSSSQLAAEVALKTPGREVTLDVLREDHPLRITVVPEPMPEMAMASRRPRTEPTEPPADADGAHLRKLTPDLAREFAVKGVSSGVLVTEVTENSPSEAAGLERGDVITSVNGKSVSTPKEFRQALNGSKTKQTKVSVLREGARTVVLFQNHSE